VSSFRLPLLATLVIGGSAILAVAGLLIVRRLFRRPMYPGENDVAGFFFAVIGVIYGVVLALINLVVWERFAATVRAVTTEAADLVAVFRDTQGFPDPLRQQAQDSLRDDAREVISSEWQSWVANGEVVPHITPDPLNEVWAIYRHVRPEDAIEATDLEHAIKRLHTLEQQRHMRHLASGATLPPLFWPVLVAGGVLTVGFSYFLRIENLTIQVAMTAVLAALISGIPFLIFSLNYPFTGQAQVDKEPFRHALQQFNALNLPVQSD
jgi:hypothetical protein